MDEEKEKKKKVVKKKKVKEVTEFKSVPEKLEKVLESDVVEHKEDNTKSGKSLFNLAEVIVVMIITALFGALVGAVFTYVNNDNNSSNNKHTVNNDAKLSEFVNTYNNILNDYYGEVSSEQLIDSAIKGMVEELGDPYSSYFDKEESKEFNEELDGEFVGMGAEITMTDSGVVITKVFEDGPASKAGIAVGDIINKVGDTDVTGLNVSEIASHIKNGESGTNVIINITRDGEEKDITITRGRVDIPSVSVNVIEFNNKKIAHMSISTFAKNTAIQFESEYNKVKDQGISGIIIDVRGNYGGYLSVAKDIADLFLEVDDVVYQTETKGNVVKTISNTEKKIGLSVVMLVDGGSASASEVLTAALSENLGTKVVGLKTYGKGTVQELYKLSNGSSIKYTTQNWLTPNGNVIDKNGITPNVEVELDEKYYDDPSDANDNQLQKALSEIVK